jgi:hypothetical protein
MFREFSGQCHFNDRDAFAALGLRRELVPLDEGMGAQQVAHGVSHFAGAFAVHDAEAGQAGAETLIEELLDLRQGFVEGLAADLDLRLGHRGLREAYPRRDHGPGSLFDSYDLADANAGAEAAEGHVELATVVWSREGLCCHRDALYPDLDAGLDLLRPDPAAAATARSATKTARRVSGSADRLLGLC